MACCYRKKIRKPRKFCSRKLVGCTLALWIDLIVGKKNNPNSIYLKKIVIWEHQNCLMNKSVRQLTITFSNHLESSKISAFRGAMIEKVGRRSIAFHNHSDEGYVYAYPVIQYKRIQSKAGIYCLGSGVDEIHKFFEQKCWKIDLHGEHVSLAIENLELNSFTLSVSDTAWRYQIKNWIALNEENYKTFRRLERITEKVLLLEKLLVGNILSFAKGMGWRLERPIVVKIQQLNGQKVIRYKGVPLLAFDVSFSANVFLPRYLGLGKSASHGFGVVYPVSSKHNQSAHYG